MAAVLIPADRVAEALGVSPRTAREYLVKEGAALKLGRGRSCGIYTTPTKLRALLGDVAGEVLAALEKGAPA
jgi:hypothetical protein